MDVKSKVATEIALKAFDQVKSSEKWNDLLLDEIDWAELEKLLPQDDLDQMLNKLNINQKSFDQLIEELNEKVDQELEELIKSEN
ncbi:hypothetical protein ACT4YA_10265 [Acinetobacter baumannii]|jgi:hypothetical protein|uniref:hypothetical protein n=1 Tax=Acinetobacter calcoaceticus/baumannii complex TaxID=909768 RepID=UPI000445AAF1|nr:hypothetical protein [Acinetobacter sp. 1179249]AZM39570.1 hypothetical protein EJP75_14120 [Acinetobacter baumannii]EXR29844.1 hypothetical protein J689_2929 [Acinetobacter sp. 1179249]